MIKERIKLVWEFKGPDAEHFAVHHEVHLKQYAAAENLLDTAFTSEELSPEFWMASITVNKSDMIKVRDALKPHRGFKA